MSKTMNILQRTINRFRRKSVNPFDGTLMQLFGNSTVNGFTIPTYENIVKYAYKGNDIVYFVVNDIAKNVASIPLIIDDEEIEMLLNNPERGKSYTDWMFQAVVYKLLSGNIYAEVIKVTEEKIKWMNLQMPNHVELIEESSNTMCNVLLGYRISCNMQKEILIDPITGESKSPTAMFHSKFFDPENPNQGLSPLVAGMKGVDPYNEASSLNNAILKNDGAPAGFVKLNMPKDELAPAPTTEQMQVISDKVNNKLGKHNAGRWAVFNWDFSFEKLGQTGAELNFKDTKESLAREIARVFGYPPFLLGFAGGSTFNNVEEARLQLWTNTVLPIAYGIVDDLKMLFSIELGRDVDIQLDTDSLLALQPIIREKRKSAREDFTAGIISLEEARAEGNYPEEINGTIFTPVGRLPLGDIDNAGMDKI